MFCPLVISRKEFPTQDIGKPLKVTWLADFHAALAELETMHGLKAADPAPLVQNSEDEEQIEPILPAENLNDLRTRLATLAALRGTWWEWPHKEEFAPLPKPFTDGKAIQPEDLNQLAMFGRALQMAHLEPTHLRPRLAAMSVYLILQWLPAAVALGCAVGTAWPFLNTPIPPVGVVWPVAAKVITLIVVAGGIHFFLGLGAATAVVSRDGIRYRRLSDTNFARESNTQTFAAWASLGNNFRRHRTDLLPRVTLALFTLAVSAWEIIPEHILGINQRLYRPRDLFDHLTSYTHASCSTITHFLLFAVFIFIGRLLTRAFKTSPKSNRFAK